MSLHSARRAHILGPLGSALNTFGLLFHQGCKIDVEFLKDCNRTYALNELFRLDLISITLSTLRSSYIDLSPAH